MRILLADDNRDIINLVGRVLELEGHEVIIARDGLEALQQVATKHPHAAILDVNMPRLEGWEVCQRIKQTTTIPVMMLTVRAEQADLARGVAVGADVYLAKPFDIPTFTDHLNRMLRATYPEER